MKTIFVAMRKSCLFKLLLQAFSFAAVSLALSVGAALAHGGDAAAHEHPQVHAAAGAHQPGHAPDAVAFPEMALTDVDGLSTTPCNGGSSGHQAGKGCCTIACHAALAAPTVNALGTIDLPRARVVGLIDRLEGRSTGRTERPPKLG